MAICEVSDSRQFVSCSATPGAAREMLKAEKTPCRAANPDDPVGELTKMAAKLPRAAGCMILMLDGSPGQTRQFRLYSSTCPGPDIACREWARRGEAAAMEVLATRKSVLLDTSDSNVKAGPAWGRSIIASPVRIHGKIVAVIDLVGAEGAMRFGPEDVSVLEVVAWLVGQALHAGHLERVLDSRFAQIALLQEAGQALGACTLAGERPEQMARLLAKSFYREMFRLGFQPRQIIGAATEIISQLSINLKKYNARLEHSDKARTAAT
jgi:L-methionine (R)-S-oxide reductase